MQDSILLIGNFLSRSLVTRSVCEDLAVHLSARGWRVLHASEIVARIPRVLDMALTALRTRRDYSIAHIECYSGNAFAWAELVGGVLRCLRKRFILTLHSGDFPDFARRWPGRVRRLFRQASVVTTPSRYLQELMKPYRADLRLLPNALDVQRYEFRSRSEPLPRLVWLRGFLNYYNPMMAVRVVAALKSDFPGVSMTMMGPDKGDGSFQETRRLASALGVQDRISFPGGVPKAEVPRKLHESDIFLNTTDRDNTPVSVIEAMASGLAVVSTSVGGIPHLLEREVDSLLVPPGDAAAMSLCVRRLLSEPGLAARLARAARDKAGQFDWAVVLPQWEAIYRGLTVEGRASRKPVIV